MSGAKSGCSTISGGRRGINKNGDRCAAAKPRSSAADIAHLNFSARFMARQQLGALVGVAVKPAAPDAVKVGKKLLVTGTGTQRTQQVPAGRGEQARVEFSVGRKPGPMTVPAKRLGDTADQADFTPAIQITVTRGEIRPISPRPSR